MQYCMANGERNRIDSVLAVSIDVTISVESRKKRPSSLPTVPKRVECHGHSEVFAASFATALLFAVHRKRKIDEGRAYEF